MKASPSAPPPTPEPPPAYTPQVAPSYPTGSGAPPPFNPSYPPPQSNYDMAALQPHVHAVGAQVRPQTPYSQVLTPAEQALHARVDALAEELTLARSHIASQEREIEHLKLSHDVNKQRIKDLEKRLVKHSEKLDTHDQMLDSAVMKIDELQMTRHDGEFNWPVRNYYQCLMEAEKGDHYAIYSPNFMDKTNGYNLDLRLYPDGDGPGKGTHLGMYIRLRPGPFDDALEFPFKGLVTFALIPPPSSALPVYEASFGITERDSKQSAWQKPKGEKANIASGIPQFLPKKEVHKYVSNGTLNVRVTVRSRNENK